MAGILVILGALVGFGAIFSGSGDDAETAAELGDDVPEGDQNSAVGGSADTPVPVDEGGGNQDLGDLLLGSDGDDALLGGDRADTLDGGAGVDTLFGGDGADVLTDNSVDYLYPRSPNGFGSLEDFLDADTGAVSDKVEPGSIEVAYGGGGDDLITLADITVFADGGAGDDTIELSGFKGFVVGGDDADVLTSDATYLEAQMGDGDDVVMAGGVVDIEGGDGNDRLIHSGGESGGLSRLDGGDGDDFLSGTSFPTHSEILLGGAGNDLLVVGANVTAYGDEGQDTFVLAPDSESGDLAPRTFIGFDSAEDFLLLDVESIRFADGSAVPAELVTTDNLDLAVAGSDSLGNPIDIQVLRLVLPDLGESIDLSVFSGAADLAVSDIILVSSVDLADGGSGYQVVSGDLTAQAVQTGWQLSPDGVVLVS